MLGQDAAPHADVALTRAQLDITDRDAVRDAISDQDVVINCAAWTDVDGAEEHEDEALRVNSEGARNVAEAAGAVLYVSSDYVFDGTKREPYVASDPVNPVSAYGRTKLAGERATAEANPRHFIARSSWLFGAGGKNFVETILRLAGEQDPLRVVNDQVGSPTFTGHLAPALVALARTEDYGIHHVSAAGSCSWFEFAREILERSGSDTRVEPCTTEEFPRPAKRPAYSVLGGGPGLPSWRDGLDAYLGVRV
jgi:dTDP-4-dehydrorhamnose reductase